MAPPPPSDATTTSCGRRISPGHKLTSNQIADVTTGVDASSLQGGPGNDWVVSCDEAATNGTKLLIWNKPPPSRSSSSDAAQAGSSCNCDDRSADSDVSGHDSSVAKQIETEGSPQDTPAGSVARTSVHEDRERTHRKLSYNDFSSTSSVIKVGSHFDHISIPNHYSVSLSIDDAEETFAAARH